MVKFFKYLFSILFVVVISMINVVPTFAQETYDTDTITCETEENQDSINSRNNEIEEEMISIDSFLIIETEDFTTRDFILSLLNQDNFSNFSIDIKDENGNVINIKSCFEGENKVLFSYKFEKGIYNVDKIHYELNNQSYVFDFTKTQFNNKFEVKDDLDYGINALNEEIDDDEKQISYQTHVQTYGWQETKYDGETSGTTGQSKRLEGITIKLIGTQYSGDILYKTHVQTYGWQEWKSNGQVSGTTGESKRLEAIQIKLSGDISNYYDVYYRVHAQNFGWLGWAKNGESAGTAGYAYRLEAIEIQLVPKGQTAPGSTENCFYEKQISYQTHVQTYGWQETKYDGETSGTTGQSKRLEGITIKLTGTQYSGDILYRTHVQTYGWQEWKSNGQVSGTTGESKRLEAIQIKLSGDISNYYDVYYRVHAQTFGWLGWAKNGEKAGTEGLSKRLEAIEIVLREKDDPITTSGKSYIGVDSIGTLSYSVNYSNTGWQDNKSNGETSGSTTNNIGINGIKINLDNSDVNSFKGNINYQIYNKDAGWSNVASNGDTLVFTDGNTINAIKISLTDELYTYCDIYYRTYITDIGWLGWAKNGQSAGSSKIGNGIEAIQIMINMKTTSAPGHNLNYYREYINSTMQSAYEINNSLGRDLRKAFDYAKNIEYSRYEPADVNSYGSENYAKYGFANQRGNCYVMAAVFTYLAQELGYDAHQVGGQQGSLNTPHSWVEIVVNGTIYVCDPDFEKELGRNGFMFTYGSSGTLKYHDYSRMN